MKNILGHIEAMTAAQDVHSLANSFEVAAQDFGYQYFVFGQFRGPDNYSSPAEPPSMFIRYPAEWENRYFDRNYIASDPLVRRVRSIGSPYLWSSLRDLSANEKIVMQEADEAGLHHGVCVPIHGPMGDSFIGSLASPFRDADPARSRPFLHLLVAHFHLQFRDLTGPVRSSPPIQLTAREKECLLWTARGKTPWDIGCILAISEHTVIHHLRTAMNKLGTTTRVLATVKAIYQGLIFP